MRHTHTHPHGRIPNYMAPLKKKGRTSLSTVWHYLLRLETRIPCEPTISLLAISIHVRTCVYTHPTEIYMCIATRDTYQNALNSISNSTTKLDTIQMPPTVEISWDSVPGQDANEQWTMLQPGHLLHKAACKQPHGKEYIPYESMSIKLTK